MPLFVVIILFLMLLVSFLLVPIALCVDTRSNQYYIQIQGLIKAGFEKHDEEVFRIKLNIMFIKFYIYPLRKRGSKKQKKIKKRHLGKPEKQLPFVRFFKILKAFKIKQFYIDMDTGNYMLNAKLYPLFILLNYNTGNFHINFQGRNQLVLIIKSRPIDIIKSFINY